MSKTKKEAKAELLKKRADNIKSGTVTLEDPIESAGKTIKKLKFLKPKGKHIKRIGQPFKLLADGAIDIDAARMGKFIEACAVCATSGEPLLLDDTDEITAKDFLECEFVMLDFFF